MHPCFLFLQGPSKTDSSRSRFTSGCCRGLRRVLLPVLLLGKMATLHAVELYVAPGGDDANPGTRAAPFASLERARDAIRELKLREGGVPDGGVSVLVGGGNYPRLTTLSLSAQDSGRTGRKPTESRPPNSISAANA